MSDVIIAGKSFNHTDGIPPMPCSQVLITKNTLLHQNILRWSDPKDTIIDGQKICTWEGTRVVRKLGSYPTSIYDGETILVNTTRDLYKFNGYIDAVSLEDIDNYYYTLFPYSANGVYSFDKNNQFKEALIYGFAIDQLNGNPYSRVSYLEDCLNAKFKPAFMNYTTDEFNYGDWEDVFFMPRPCMLKSDGTVDYYLNPNDYSLKEDGTASDISSSAYDGNCMIEFPQVWMKFTNNGNRQEVRISNVQADEDFKCYTHYNKDGYLVPYIYMAAYTGANVSSKLRSISGLSPMVSQTAQTEINYATANGNYWYTDVLADRMMVNMLLTLIGKSTDGQTIFGQGRMSGGSSSSYNQLVAGTMNTRGLFWGDQNNSGVKVFGMENFWGNVWRRTAGYINANGTQKIKLTYGQQDGSTVDGYNLTGADYISIGLTPAGTSGGYISSATLNQYGIYPVVASGTSSTYFCDGMWFNNGQTNYARFGGTSYTGLLDGPFSVALDRAPSNANWDVGAALSCKPPLS